MTSILRRAGLRAVALLVAAWAAAPLGASAQEFPVRPVKFIVPFPPGGPVDTVARALAQKVSEYWAQPVLLAHHLGAGGIVGAEAASRAAPDGYTGFVWGIHHSVLPSLGMKLPYDIDRDFTRGNISLGPNGERYAAVLMDFGLVTMLKTPTNITMRSDVMGTIDYMAPEQIVQTQTVDLRSDIYALGAVYYEMLTGKRPFSGGPAQVLFGHLYQPPPDPRQVRPELPRGLSHAIMRALAKSPDDRFQTVQEFVEAAGAPEVEAAAAA